MVFYFFIWTDKINQNFKEQRHIVKNLCDLEKENVEEKEDFENLNIDEEFKKNNEKLKRLEEIKEYRKIYSEKKPRVKSSNDRSFGYGF